MAAVRRFRYGVDPDFDLRLVLFSHGWIDLPPFAWDEQSGVCTLALDLGRRAVDVEVRRVRSGLQATVTSARPLGERDALAARAAVPWMLRLDQDLSSFWALCERSERLAWVARRGAGRILRCPSVFEDLMKLLFTTNCSWSATRLMTGRLVEALGRRAPSGRSAFPTAAACAAKDEAFYRDVVRAGYRASACVDLARKFAAGEIDGAWFTAAPAATARERLLELRGFGSYAAGQALRTLGHYKDLALDSWCRGRLRGTDAEVARRYAAFDPYDGLAMWMDLTADWHGV